MSGRIRTALIAAVLGLKLGLTGWCQPESPDLIETDNPSLANSPKTVGKGVFQWESGFFHQDPRGQLLRTGRSRFQREDNESNEGSYASFPNLFRVGVSDDLELRFESETLALQGYQNGFSDVSLGFKWTAFEGEDVTVGMIGLLTPPSGHFPFRTESFTPTLILASDFTLNPQQSLTLNLGGSLIDSDLRGGRFFENFGALCFNQSFNETWTGYAEIAVSGPDVGTGIMETTADIGLGYRPTSNSIINLALFRGLSAQGMDWGLNLSFGIRN